MLMKRILFIAMLGGIGFTTVQCTKTIEERVEVIRERGNAILSGNGVPDASLGKVGDYYLDLSGVNLYGAKTAEGWGNPISLRGLKGDKGNDGQNGTDAPVPNIKGGYWYIGETNTGIKAEGKDGSNGSNGKTPYIGNNGNWFVDGEDLGVKAKGEKGNKGDDGVNGKTPYIGNNGNWFVDGQDLGVKAKGEKGNKGDKGADGETPRIGNNGNWFVGNHDTGVKAQGEKGNKGDKGADGETPRVGDNGNWWIGNKDTNIKVQGLKGDPGATGAQGEKGERGLPGKDGSVIYADKGKPTTQGKDGDYYIDTEAKIFYGPKANSSWPTTGISLTGKNINNEDYQLSDDGKTLIKWLNPKTRFIDMDADPRLREVTKIYKRAFVEFKKDYELTTIIIGDNVTEIGESAFSSCQKLRRVELPDGITRINKGTFSVCKNLQHIDLPDGLTFIGDNAFASCKKLTMLTIPEGVTKFGNRTFQDCINLHTLVILQPNAFNIDVDKQNTFRATVLRNIYVPNGSADAYKAANPTYKDIIR